MWRGRRWEEGNLVAMAATSPSDFGGGSGEEGTAERAFSPRPQTGYEFKYSSEQFAELASSSFASSPASSLSPREGTTSVNGEVGEDDGAAQGIDGTTPMPGRMVRSKRDKSPRLLEQLFSHNSREAQLMARVRQTRMQRYMTRQNRMKLPPVFESE